LPSIAEIFVVSASFMGRNFRKNLTARQLIIL
jgi:hypothetical protein